MKFLTSLILALSLNVYASDYKDHWARTQLSFEQILTGQEFGQKSCTSDVHVFTACLMTMNGSLNLKQPNYRHYLYPDLRSSGEYAGFKVTKLKVGSADMSNFHKKYLASMSELYKTFIEQNRMSRQLVFDDAYQVMKRDSKVSGEEAYIAGTLLNTMLGYIYDPFTKVSPVSNFYDYSETKGAFGFKLGAARVKGQDHLVISYVYKDSPAQKVGLRKGDILVEVEREVRSEEMMDILSKRNEVMLAFKRAGKIKEVKLKRTEVEFPNVISEKYQVAQTNFGLIRIDSFNNPRTCQDFIIHAEKLINNDGIKGLVIDLRGNGGGLVNEFICISSQFLEGNSINWVIQDLETGRYDVQRKTYSQGPRYRLPIVVMVNAASASASEAFALYLKSYRKAWIVGERTFGKGTMQSSGQVHPKLVFSQTVAKYYGPNGVSPQIQGVNPDFKIFPTFFQKTDTPAVRITDTFDVVIPHHEVIEPEMDDRLEEKSSILKCVKGPKRVDLKYAKLGEVGELVEDYQLDKSLEILECHIKQKIPEFRSIKIPVVKLQ